MAFPSFFIIILIFSILFRYEIYKTTRIENKQKDAYWAKEQKSLIVRKKAFSPTDFIHPNMDSLQIIRPQNLSDSEDLHYQQLLHKLKELSTLDMMNFQNFTNSELRLKFGTANQSIIATNETHFDSFLKTVGQYGKFMLAYDINEARRAYEMAVSIGSEYSEHYYQLGLIYLQDNEKEALSLLKEKASHLESLNQIAILKKLEKLNPNAPS